MGNKSKRILGVEWPKLLPKRPFNYVSITRTIKFDVMQFKLADFVFNTLLLFIGTTPRRLKRQFLVIVDVLLEL